MECNDTPRRKYSLAVLVNLTTAVATALFLVLLLGETFAPGHDQILVRFVAPILSAALHSFIRKRVESVSDLVCVDTEQQKNPEEAFHDASK